MAADEGLSWTGCTFSYTQKEAKNLMYALEDRASKWTLATILLTGISASVPNPGTIAAASAIMAWGNDKVATEISRKNGSKRMYLKIQWLPYPDIVGTTK